jgi:archaellum component FlaC
MEPVKGKRPDTFQYMLDLTRGITPENFFSPRPVTARQMMERISNLERELDIRRRREGEKDGLLSKYESTQTMNRSYKTLGRQVTKLSEDENPTEFDKPRRVRIPMET